MCLIILLVALIAVLADVFSVVNVSSHLHQYLFLLHSHRITIKAKRLSVRGYGKQKRTTHIKSFVPVKVKDKYLFALSTLVLTILMYCDH